MYAESWWDWLHVCIQQLLLKSFSKKGFRISNLLSYKGTLPLICQSGVVYQIKCESWEPSAVYIWKTKNTLHERFYGPNGHLLPSTSNSPLLHHLDLNLNSKCEFNCDNIMILDRCNNDYKLRFMESIYLMITLQIMYTFMISRMYTCFYKTGPQG